MCRKRKPYAFSPTFQIRELSKTYIFKDRCVVKLNEFLSKYSVHCVNVTCMGPVGVMHTYKTQTLNKKRFQFFFFFFVGKLLVELTGLTCKV